jgi:regulator of sigma E protease
LALYIILGILIFGLIILIHEFGHFLFAKLFKVGINEFAIGMGPKLWYKTGKDNVLYSLRAFPIGGYVSMVGEDDDGNDDESALCKKPLWQRFVIISAGAFMNIALGFIIMAIVVILSGEIYSTQIERFNFADENGNLIQMDSWQNLNVGDKIIKVGDRHIFVRSDLLFEAMNVADTPTTLTVVRNGQKLEIDNFVFPTFVESGVKMGNANFFVPTSLPKTFVEVTKQSICQSVSVIRMIYTSLFNTLKGKYGADAVSGPVGVINEIKNTASLGFGALLYLMMIISMNVGIFNLLPLPALDGGRMIFLIIEGIRRKPLKKEIEQSINTAGLMILLALMLLVTLKDVVNLF